MAVAMPLLVAACGQNGSDNMMAPNATALSPAQIDLALGPEPADNGAGPANEVTAPEAEEPRTTVAPEPEPAPDEPAEEEPAVEDEAELPPDGNNSTEE